MPQLCPESRAQDSPRLPLILQTTCESGWRPFAHHVLLGTKRGASWIMASSHNNVHCSLLVPQSTSGDRFFISFLSYELRPPLSSCTKVMYTAGNAESTPCIICLALVPKLWQASQTFLWSSQNVAPKLLIQCIRDAQLGCQHSHCQHGKSCLPSPILGRHVFARMEDLSNEMPKSLIRCQRNALLQCLHCSTDLPVVYDLYQNSHPRIEDVSRISSFSSCFVDP